MIKVANYLRPMQGGIPETSIPANAQDVVELRRQR